MVLENQLPHKNRQLVDLISGGKQHVDDLMVEMTFRNHLIETFCEMRLSRVLPPTLSALEATQGQMDDFLVNSHTNATRIG